MNHDPACPELDSGTPILDLFRIMVEAIFLFCHPELVSGSHLFSIDCRGHGIHPSWLIDSFLRCD
jgi:hypothetical protein